MVKLVLALALVGMVSAQNFEMTAEDWTEKCPDPLHMVELDIDETGPFKDYDVDGDGSISVADVKSIYTAMDITEVHAEMAFKQMDQDNDGAVDEGEFAAAGMQQRCAGPTLGADGHCPTPYILDGEVGFFTLRAEHFELEKLTWHEMIHMSNVELRDFLKDHEVPYTIRIKVLDLHDAQGGTKNTGCVPSPPRCHNPLEYSDGECLLPKPHYVNPVIDDAWIGPVLVTDGAYHQEKAKRVHQPVLEDEGDAKMVAERHAETKAIWKQLEDPNVKVHTGH